MAQTVVVQDGVITFRTSDSSKQVNFHVKGQLNASGVSSLNGVEYPDGSVTPISGMYMGSSVSNTLQFYPFVLAINGSDVLTLAALNSTYPAAQPGQSVLGPTVVYLCTAASVWRKYSAPLVT